MPRRIQRKREKGWRLPPNARSVTRPGRWGNPLVGPRAAAWFRVWLCNPSAPLADAIVGARQNGCDLMIHPSWEDWRWRPASQYLDGIEELRGKDLACYCRMPAPCHADVLIDFANR